MLIIGHSMGAWISLWLRTKSEISEKIKGLVLLAPALNFFIPQFEEIFKFLPTEIQNYLEVDGNVHYMDVMGHKNLPIRKSLAYNSREYEIRDRVFTDRESLLPYIIYRHRDNLETDFLVFETIHP